MSLTKVTYSMIDGAPVNVKDFGIVSDGATSQTSALIALFSSLGSSGYRGVVYIPPNTKFDIASVYSAVPTGLILKDNSFINWGQPPGYKNKFLITYSGDVESDDTQEILASGHHPSMALLNMGTAGSTSASLRRATILHGVGKNYDGNMILGWIHQYSKDPASDQWLSALRIQTPYSVAIANPQLWVASTAYAANSYCVSDGGKIYTTISGGTSGSTAPSGTGAGINDGGVLWDYVQAAINIDSTRFEWYEDGKSVQYAPAGGIARHTLRAGAKSFRYEIDDTTGSITFRDVTRGADIFSVSTANGNQQGIATSFNRLSITGTDPNAPSTGAGQVANISATNMATMIPPAGKIRMVVNLRFNNSNTTVVHGTGTNNFTLKGGVNATPSVGQFMTFEYDSSLSPRWFEVSRSF